MPRSEYQEAHRGQRPHHPQRRGDNIPPVSDYAHYNEEAELIWYLENRYDMEHADELLDEDDSEPIDEDEEDEA